MQTKLIIVPSGISDPSALFSKYVEIENANSFISNHIGSEFQCLPIQNQNIEVYYSDDIQIPVEYRENTLLKTALKEIGKENRFVNNFYNQLCQLSILDSYEKIRGTVIIRVKNPALLNEFENYINSKKISNIPEIEMEDEFDSEEIPYSDEEIERKENVYYKICNDENRVKNITPAEFLITKKKLIQREKKSHVTIYSNFNEKCLEENYLAKFFISKIKNLGIGETCELQSCNLSLKGTIYIAIDSKLHDHVDKFFDKDYYNFIGCYNHKKRFLINK